MRFFAGAEAGTVCWVPRTHSGSEGRVGAQADPL